MGYKHVNAQADCEENLSRDDGKVARALNNVMRIFKLELRNVLITS